VDAQLFNSFNGLSMILKPAAALCVGWAITLIGKKLDGSKLSMLAFHALWIV